MILIAMGANLPSNYGEPEETLEAAMKQLEQQGVKILERSRIWLTPPWPYNPDDPWFRNNVISVETELPPRDLLGLLLSIEEEFGRVRTVKNAPRLLDMDIIAYHDEIINEDHLQVPHAQMHKRSFVLMPLSDISKKWIHPASGQTVAEMIQNLPLEGEGLEAKPMEQVAA